MAAKPRSDTTLGPIVSSAHLASGAMPALSELEFGMILLGHAFERWMVRCMAASGVPDLSPLDVLVLHTIAHRARAKKVADICLVLNIEDTHLVTYSLKKLDAHKLLATGRSGSEKTVSLTPKGDQVVPIPGTKRVKYLQENMQALEVVLSPTEVSKLEAVFPVGASAGERYGEANMKLVDA